MTADTQLPANVPCLGIFVIYWPLVLVFNNERLASCVGVINLYAAFHNVWSHFLPPKKLKMPYLLGLVEIQEIPVSGNKQVSSKAVFFQQVLEMLARLDSLSFKASQELLY